MLEDNNLLNDTQKLIKEATNRAIRNSSLELPFSSNLSLDEIPKENIPPPWSSKNHQDMKTYVSGNESFEIGLILFGGNSVERELLKELTKSYNELQSLQEGQELIT